MKKQMPTNGKMFAKTIPILAQALGRSFQHLYRLEKQGIFAHTTRGYHIEKIRKSLLTHNGQNHTEKDEAAKWDLEFRKWKALKAKMEYAEARGFLTNRANAIKEQVRREAEFVRAVRRLRFDLPPKLHGVPIDEWPNIIDQAGTEMLATIVRRLTKTR